MKYDPVVKTIECPTDAQLIDREVMSGPSGPIPVLKCPECGFAFSHVQAVYTLIGGDEGGDLYRGSHLVARETPYRRDGLAVRVEGECGHRWDFVFQQHKGQTFIRLDILKPSAGNTNPSEKKRTY
jgi:hypothetical protein